MQRKQEIWRGTYIALLSVRGWSRKHWLETARFRNSDGEVAFFFFWSIHKINKYLNWIFTGKCHYLDI